VPGGWGLFEHQPKAQKFRNANKATESREARTTAPRELQVKHD
jgi:hypothetical protein